MNYDLIIIGAGPAGLTAAIYAQRAKLNTLVVERSPISGGQVLTTYEVDNYPGEKGIGGYDLGVKFREHADALGAQFMEAEVEKIVLEGAWKMVHTDQGELRAKAVILATGATHAKLNVPGEEELAGMGVSYCATCDGAFFRNKTVAVVGGGDVAVEDAIFLARVCGQVYLVHRREELRAARVLQEALFALPNVECVWNSELQKIDGTDQVTGVVVRNKQTGEEREMAVDGVFIAVGIHPNTEEYRDLVACDEGGYVVAGEDCVTSVPGIFAAGDGRTKQLRQIVTAVADGANAVTSVQNYLLTFDK
ncbi:MAG: thioredoxin-disulfide reductase [Lachnospiraceae bacterium]